MAHRICTHRFDERNITHSSINPGSPSWPKSGYSMSCFSVFKRLYAANCVDAGHALILKSHAPEHLCPYSRYEILHVDVTQPGKIFLFLFMPGVVRTEEVFKLFISASPAVQLPDSPVITQERIQHGRTPDFRHQRRTYQGQSAPLGTAVDRILALSVSGKFFTAFTNRAVSMKICRNSSAFDPSSSPRIICP